MKNGLSLLLITMFFFVSCEDPIDVDLEEGEKLLIVDGLITDQPLPYQVKLSTTAPYFDKENPPVKDAVLTLTDSEGNTEILTYTDDGVFLIKTIQGKIGNDYTLQIQYEGQNYTAETSIRRAPRLDSLLIKDEVEADREGEDDDDKDIDRLGMYISFFLQEIEGLGDSFRIKIYRDGVFQNLPSDLNVFNDKYFDGNYIADRNINDEPFYIGEKVKVEIYSITEDQYYFYEEMSAQIENTGLFSNPPANVRTNINNTDPNGNKAAGYFGGASVRSIEGTINDNLQVIK